MADTLPGPRDEPIRRLEGWITLPEIGEHLGITKQGVHSMVFEYAAFSADDMRFVGRVEQPMYLVRESAWQAELDRRERAARVRAERAEAAERERAEQERTTRLRQQMRALLGDAGIAGKDVRNDYVGKVLGRPIDDWYTRTPEEATKVIAALKRQLAR